MRYAYIVYHVSYIIYVLAGMVCYVCPGAVRPALRRGQAFVAGKRRAQVLGIYDLEFTLQSWGPGFKVQDFGVQAKAGKRRQMM